MSKGGRGAIGHIEMHCEKQKSKMRKHGDSGDREKLGGRGKFVVARMINNSWSGKMTVSRIRQSTSGGRPVTTGHCCCSNASENVIRLRCREDRDFGE